MSEIVYLFDGKLATNNDILQEPMRWVTSQSDCMMPHANYLHHPGIPNDGQTFPKFRTLIGGTAQVLQKKWFLHVSSNRYLTHPYAILRSIHRIAVSFRAKNAGTETHRKRGDNFPTSKKTGVTL